MSCLTDIQSHIVAGTINTLPVLGHLVSRPLLFDGSANQLYRVEVEMTQVIGFSVYLAVSFAVNATMTVYRIVGSNAVPVGGITMTQQTSTFNVDLTVGTYVLCFASANFRPYVGSVTANFQAFPTVANLELDLATGTSVAFGFAAREPKPCGEDLLYQLIEGSLPPGLELLGSGQIVGTLPDMDCIEDNEKLSPSQNWYYDDIDGRAQPWGRQWRFKARIMLEEDPLTFADRWFCVKVHNNWSWDRDRFLERAPFQEEIRWQETITNKIKAPDCPGCPEPVKVELRPLDPRVSCEECPSEPPAVEIIPIPPLFPKTDQVDEMVEWWKQNVERDDLDSATRAFINKLGESPLFRRRIAASQTFNPLPETQTQVAMSIFNGQVVLAESRLVDGRRPEDLDFRMIEKKIQQNQKLPTEIVFGEGASMTLNMS